MSPSGSRRRQPARTSRPSRGRGSRMPAIWSALIVMAVWSIATGAYFAFRDDVTNPMTEMQMTYEKRIADVRAQFASAMSQQLLDKANPTAAQRPATVAGDARTARIRAY